MKKLTVITIVMLLLAFFGCEKEDESQYLVKWEEVEVRAFDAEDYTSITVKDDLWNETSAYLELSTEKEEFIVFAIKRKNKTSRNWECFDVFRAKDLLEVNKLIEKIKGE